jgi:hypothetical protein
MNYTLIQHLEPRQEGGLSGPAAALLSSLTSGNIPKRKAIKIEEIKATIPGAKRVRIVYGPYVLKAANVGLTED